MGDYPTLAFLDTAYGKSASLAWLTPQLYNLVDFCGCKGKLTVEQLDTTVVMINAEYSHLKITELMLFFFRMKGGHYGVFYGCIDPMKIMASLLEFMEERSSFFAAYDMRKREERILEDKRRCMTYAEFMKLEKEKNNS